MNWRHVTYPSRVTWLYTPPPRHFLIEFGWITKSIFEKTGVDTSTPVHPVKPPLQACPNPVAALSTRKLQSMSSPIQISSTLFQIQSAKTTNIECTIVIPKNSYKHDHFKRLNVNVELHGTDCLEGEMFAKQQAKVETEWIGYKKHFWIFVQYVHSLEFMWMMPQTQRCYLLHEELNRQFLRVQTI